MKIYKYDLEDEVEMPEGAEILSVQMQHGATVIWAAVDENKPRIIRKFHETVTGGDVPKYSKHLATLQLHGGHYVTHVFEVFS